MSVSCGCGGDYEWWYVPAKDYQLLDTKYRRKCNSCLKVIEIGETCLKFFKWREPRTDIEERVYGDEVPMAPFYHCEECADIYFSIDELGYCLTLDGTPMKEEAAMVAEIERFKREEKNRAERSDNRPKI